MGYNPFKNSSNQAKAGSWGGLGRDGMTPIDSGLRSVAVTFSDWSDSATLTNEERQTLQDAKSGSKEVKMKASDQRKLIRKAKEAEKKAKAAKKAADEKAKQDKKTGTRRY